MTVLVGPNNSGKTNILLALNKLFYKKERGELEKEKDFRLVGGERQSPIELLTMIEISKEDITKELPSKVLDIIQEGKLFLKKVYALEDDDTSNKLYVGKSAKEEDLIEIKGQDKKKLVSWLPDVRYTQPEETKETTTALIRDMISLIVEESSDVNNAKQGYSSVFSDSNLLDSIKSIEEKFSKFLSGWWQDAGIKLNIAPIEFSDVISKSIHVGFSEGKEISSVDMIGTGLQRAVMIGALTIYAEHAESIRKIEGGKRHALQIFAIEEPELYLHPHLQRRMYDVLQRISATDQVVMSTHSQNLVRLEDFNLIRLVRKNANDGSYVSMWPVKEVTAHRERFLYITKINPASELFFAKKVVLVEGEAEMVCMPYIIEQKLKKGNLDELGISVVNCQGKGNITYFQDVLNAFKIPYIVVYDKDGLDEKNEEIVKLAKVNTDVTHVITPNFEKVLAEAIKSSNIPQDPHACYKIVIDMKVEQIPETLLKLTEKIFGKEAS